VTAGGNASGATAASARVVDAQARAIAIDHVSMMFAGRDPSQRVHALDDVSLDIRKGEFVCLLGPSGCGKSTLLSIIGGMLEQTAGTVTVNGTPVSSPRPNEIAYVFQESTLFPWFTVLENFRLALKFRGIEEANWRDRAMQSLCAVGMEQFASHYPKQLSVGMKQRINLARGLCVGSEVLLLDEPFAALDEQTRMVLGEDLSILLARRGKTIVFVTHSLAEAVFLADRIVVMTARPGKVKASISVPEPHPRSPDFMLTDAFQDIRKELYGLLRDEIRQTVAAMRLARDAQA
jgi:ABC-type nitrate/sulfonate/bicarbonate transport system ATPase subunit